MYLAAESNEGGQEGEQKKASHNRDNINHANLIRKDPVTWKMSYENAVMS